MPKKGQREQCLRLFFEVAFAYGGLHVVSEGVVEMDGAVDLGGTVDVVGVEGDGCSAEGEGAASERCCKDVVAADGKGVVHDGIDVGGVGCDAWTTLGTSMEDVESSCWSASVLSSVLGLFWILRSLAVSSSIRDNINSATSEPPTQCWISMFLCSAAANRTISIICVCICRVAMSSSRAAMARCRAWLYADCKDIRCVLKGGGRR